MVKIRFHVGRVSPNQVVVPTKLDRVDPPQVLLRYGERQHRLHVVHTTDDDRSSVNQNGQIEWTLSPQAIRALLLPPSGTLHCRRNGEELKIGPVMGIYVHDFQEKRRRFGEQTLLLRELIQLGTKSGVDVIVLTPTCLTQGSGYRYDEKSKQWQKVSVPYPDVVLRRSGNFFALNRVAKRELGELKKSGRLYTLPRDCSNKWTLYQVLSGSQRLVKHLPLTTRATCGSQVYTAVKSRRDVYVKPLAASQGASVYHLRWHDGVVIASWEEPTRLQGERPRPAPQGKWTEERRYANQGEFLEFWNRTQLKRCIIQDTVRLLRTNENCPFDFRWLVQHDHGQFTVRARVARVGNPSSVTTNVHSGAVAVSASEALKRAGWKHVDMSVKELDRVALAVAQQLEGKFGSFAEVGVDLALQEDGAVMVFEVNPTPGRKMLRVLDDGSREMSLLSLLEYAIRATGFDSGN